MIVIDLGCATRGSEESVETLIDRFHPDTLYGFDPSEQLDEEDKQVGGTRLVTCRQAAWTHAGTVGFVEDGMTSRLAGSTNKVACFDLARFIESLDSNVILKLDVEGAEYALLEHLLDSGVIAWVEHLLVEWHGEQAVRQMRILERLECPVEEWPK